MATGKRKLKMLSIAEKVTVIRAVEKGDKKKVEIAKQFGIPTSTLSTFLKEKEKILKLYSEKSCGHQKRMRECEYPVTEQCILKWFVQARDRNIPIDGKLLQAKAEEFAKELGHSEFKVSNGWLDKFKKRHGIVFNRLCGESAQVPEEDSIHWIQKLPEIVQDYSPDDVFNADETGLFFKCTPDKTMTFKGEPCQGGKKSKEHVTLLLGANMSGLEKLPALLIGKSLKPRCFKNVKSLPMHYKANKKAWMTSELFSKWLKKVDAAMVRKKRRIILFIDSCTAHNHIPVMNAVTIKFFPPNMTSKLQPLDQGIINNFKLRYHKLVVRKLLWDIEDKRPLGIDLLEAMRMAWRAWDEVPEETIKNCFKKAGFGQQTIEDSEEHLEGMSMETDNTLASPEECSTVLTATGANKEVSFQDFLKVDSAVNVCGELTDADIIAEVANKEQKENEKARQAIDILRRFLESTPDLEENMFRSIDEIEEIVERDASAHQRQTKRLCLPQN
uniref:Tigger transposable element-derived protein 4 n=1 Tax=Erpetoichthys calabaricus TaxID=27687 RepID=A0A8C4XF96_ERPCA